MMKPQTQDLTVNVGIAPFPVGMSPAQQVGKVSRPFGGAMRRVDASVAVPVNVGGLYGLSGTIPGVTDKAKSGTGAALLLGGTLLLLPLIGSWAVFFPLAFFWLWVFTPGVTLEKTKAPKKERNEPMPDYFDI